MNEVEESGLLRAGDDEAPVRNIQSVAGGNSAGKQGRRLYLAAVGAVFLAACAILAYASSHASGTVATREPVPAGMRLVLAEKKEEEEKEEKEEKEEEPKMEADDEEIDPFAAGDVCDIGNGEPLFAKFTWEDWMLLNLRIELHLLVHSFRMDVNDPERPSFHEKHLPFYYNRYFNKTFSLKTYGVSSVVELLELVRDTMEVTPGSSILDAQLAEDTPMDNFVKLTEDERRERLRRLDMGDEASALNFQRNAPRGNPADYRGHHQGQHQGQHQPQRDQRGSGYPSRSGPPPPGPQGGRQGPPPSSRMQPPSMQPPRYQTTSGSGRDGSRGYSDYRSGGGSTRSGSGGCGSIGAPPPRYGAPPPAPPPARSYPSSGGFSSYGGGAPQKRSYPQPSSSGGHQSYNKQPRTSNYSSSFGPPPGQGSKGGSSYGNDRGSGYGGGYRR